MWIPGDLPPCGCGWRLWLERFYCYSSSLVWLKCLKVDLHLTSQVSRHLTRIMLHVPWFYQDGGLILPIATLLMH
jgi:hypothetical protein